VLAPESPEPVEARAERTVKVAIIGSGPAGLSAATHAAAKGMAHVLIEKTDHLSDTIFKYQRGKTVMATPSELALRSDLTFGITHREPLLESWNSTVAASKVDVMLKAEVVSVTGQAGAFTIAIADGRVVRAETVVMAIGTQGNPNLVRCPVAEGAVVDYTLADAGAFIDENIVVIGGGDAGIENALGLIAEPEQRNIVTLVNRSEEFATAKDANVKALLAAEAEGRITVLRGATVDDIRKSDIAVKTRDGTLTLPCNRVIARMGSAPPRTFVEKCCAGVQFTSEDRAAYPQLSQSFESTVPGIYLIGALAGYPLIKHCMNQGYDVIEYISGNLDLKPVDEPILEAKFKDLGERRTVVEWLEFLRANVVILNELSMLQMREFMLDSQVRRFAAGATVFEKNEPGSSLFGIAEGTLEVIAESGPPVPVGHGSILGEVGLISGRRRGATVRAATAALVVEVPRTAALRLMAQVPAAGRAVQRIATERQLLQIFGSALVPADLDEILADAKVVPVDAGEIVVHEDEPGSDIFVVRSGSMIVEKRIGDRPVFLSYLPAGSYFGEMAVIDHAPRSATVRAAIRSEVLKIDGAAFSRLLERRPALAERARAEMAARGAVNSYIEASKDSFSNVVDMYSSVASFLIENGIGEATDVLLIDEKLCVDCDNCEKACADSHDGLSRLDREAGRTYAHLHVPTSCRHCEHPHCMADCPPNAITRGPDGEVRLDSVPEKKPSLIEWMLLGRGPGPGEPNPAWLKKHHKADAPKQAVKCDMCAGVDGGPACVRACPTGAAIRVAPEDFLAAVRLKREAI
jgi:CRP-like cAMP-binding protein/thioredoxin reductase/Fe-S-cluster-containing hydrogenase component 2